MVEPRLEPSHLWVFLTFSLIPLSGTPSSVIVPRTGLGMFLSSFISHPFVFLLRFLVDFLNFVFHSLIFPSDFIFPRAHFSPNVPFVCVCVFVVAYVLFTCFVIAYLPEDKFDFIFSLRTFSSHGFFCSFWSLVVISDSSAIQ